MEPKNIAASATVTAFGAATAASVVAATVATTTVATVALSVLAVTSAAVSIASMTAWADEKSKDATTYFQNVVHHSACAVPAMVQFTTQIMVQSLVQGVTRGISRNIDRKIAGPDVIIEQKKQQVQK